ncbi:MAG: hypothetical protein LQ351_000667 [Letrouitia transgressa]|nr:MAG: hypothetical protein LQ351_000667 [Letrouitia transgressa]
MTTVESDLRRMIGNAKYFNEKSSQVFSDAEKIRKAVVNFMLENNPAYKRKDYVPFPTPVPPDWQSRLSVPKEEVEQEVNTSENTNVAGRPSRATSTPAVQDAEGAGQSFDGNTFQLAQEKILTELINLTNDRGELISGPFINLPSRELRDYYHVVRHPVSLKGVQKAVKGIKGRDKPTGVSLFKSWNAFEEEINFIWNNARQYNEDGSEISKMAEALEESKTSISAPYLLTSTLQTYFIRRLGEAKAAVSEPPQPKVTLRMPAKEPDPPKITLKFGNQKINGSTGVSVDGEALKRQQELVNAGANGQISASNSRNHVGNAGTGTTTAAAAAPLLQRSPHERTRSSSTEYPAANGIKTEASQLQSPALGTVQMSAERSGSAETRQSPGISLMPPPANVTPRIASGSPRPQLSAMHSHSLHSYSMAYNANSARRPAGKGTNTQRLQNFSKSLADDTDALITNVSISTHPGLKIDKHFHLDIPPVAESTYQSITITLPSTHYYLRIVPTMTSQVSQRPFKIFVTVNNQRLNTIPQMPESSDQRKPVYESRFMPGVNRIEVEMVAGIPRGVPKIGTGPELEVEKFTIFAHLVKD